MVDAIWHRLILSALIHVSVHSLRNECLCGWGAPAVIEAIHLKGRVPAISVNDVPVPVPVRGTITT